MSSSKLLPAVVASLALTYHILAVALCQYLPYDPLYLGVSVSAYAWIGCVLSSLGLIGILRTNITLIAAFANFLLVDTFVSALYRLLILQLLLGTFYDDNVCKDIYLMTFHQPPLSNESCSGLFAYTEIVTIAFFALLTAGQAGVSVIMRRYVSNLERIEQRSSITNGIIFPSNQYQSPCAWQRRKDSERSHASRLSSSMRDAIRLEKELV